MADVTDARSCAELASKAGDSLLALRASFEEGEAPKARGQRGDARSQEVLATALSGDFPSDAVLSEEAQDSAGRLRSRRVWIIDPLDGTREYGEGRNDWAVHVALWENGELAAGAVAIPGEGLVLDSATVSSPPKQDPAAPPKLAVSRSRPPSITESVRSALDADLVPMGSAGVKIAAVIRGQVDAYVHAGGQFEWDSAAPVAVARAAGLFTSRIDGSPLVYNGADPYLPDLVVCRPELADAILTAIANAADGEIA